MSKLFPTPDLSIFQRGATIYAIKVRESLENIKETFGKRDLERLYANGIIPGAYKERDYSVLFFYAPPVIFYPKKDPIRRMNMSGLESRLISLGYLKIVSKEESPKDRSIILHPLGIDVEPINYSGDSEENARIFLSILKDKYPKLLDAILTYNINLGNYRLLDKTMYTREGIFEYDNKEGFHAKLAFIDLYYSGREVKLTIYKLRYEKGEPIELDLYEAKLIERAFLKELRAFKRGEKEFADIADGWVDDRLREVEIKEFDREDLDKMKKNTRKFLEKLFYWKNYKNKLSTALTRDYIVEINRKKSPEKYLLDIEKGRILRLPIPPKRIPASLIHKLVRQG